jgi:acyl-CoA synthetase (AMP-forming)/AMP-acid ligase II
MYHAYAQTVFTMNNPRMGIPSYVMRKFDFIQMLEWVQKYRITTLSLVPPIVVSLTKRPEVAAYDLRSLELVGCGAAPLSRETADAFARRFGAHADLRQGWGMTEVTCSALGHSPAADEEEPDLSSVGEPNPNVEAQIVDPATGLELPPGRRGELWIRGPNVMKGYWRRPGDTARTLTPEGWLMTGDVAFRDARGAVHIVDRIKELIKRKGLQIAPAELEGLLLDHPRVADAAVVGVTV